ncbi:copper amine oxidase [Nesterenkonia sp. HG001]|uniref:copper amine oxidase n=1 Tax=Nesterenkonia sp. HG001 TaxID=2983207 RepID=UPI002AC6E366|nr:copper amine oxidase [Nesterenkonia sp. HG001]MDZ5077396.1 copper amine oxidase [Nesterenkonia sp. HG001]
MPRLNLPRIPAALLSAGAVISLLLVGCADAETETAAETEPDVSHLDCGHGLPLEQTMASGSSWSMCFSVDPKRGMVLSDIHFAAADREPVQLIQELSLAQMEVPYDDGERLTSDITEAGFGGTRMHSLTETECLGDRLALEIPNIGDGTQHGESPEREVLCSETQDSGLAYRSHADGMLTVARGDEWRLSTISKVGWYEYISEYTFGSDGSIRPALGATGDLSPVDYTDEDHGWPVGDGDADYAASHSHNVVWKVHWDLGEDEEMAVEQYDAEPTGDAGSQSPIVEGSLTRISEPSAHHGDDRRWWRVMAPDLLNDNGHPISYEINLGVTDSFTFVEEGHHHGEDAGYDIAFTNHDECQVFATRNRGGCGRTVLDYIDEDDTGTLEDIVSWVAIGYHHVPRDEDQSPMEMHWQSFTMGPRDFTSTRADVPEEREGIDGMPEDSEFTRHLDDDGSDIDLDELDDLEEPQDD